MLRNSKTTKKLKGKDLVTLQVQLSLGPFLKPHEMQTVLQHIDDASTTVGTHYIQGIKTINPRFNPHSAAYKVGHFTGKYILPTIGPGLVRARPPTTHLTTKAAQMLETLEARLAARSEAFFPELHPAITSGPRSLPTQRVPSTTKPPASLSRTGASKPPISTEPPNLPSEEKVAASKLAERNVNVEVITGGAYNRAQFEKYKTFLRAEMEKPHVMDPCLEKIINKIYKPHAEIGSGSTAAGIRHELATGKKVFDKFHSQKGKEMITGLEKWLRNNPNASHGDRAAAENIIKDLINALGE